MKIILSSRRHHYAARVSIFFITVALIAGMVGCGPPVEKEPQEIQTWYHLDDIRNDLGGTYVLGNNLDSTTDGWEELANATANAGKGWEPIGTENQPFTGTFDGGGLSINGLHISRPDEDDVGLFGYVEGGIIENVGLMEVDVTGRTHTGALVGYNWKGIVGYGVRGTVNNCYSTGSVTGSDTVGGLVGLNKRGTVSLSGSSVDVYHVPGQCWRAGGLVGSNWGNVILCSYNGSVTGDHEVGGLVGLNLGNVLSCQGRHTVDGRYFVGGGAGANVWPGNLDGNALHFTLNNETSFMALSESGTGDSGLPDTAPQGSYVGILAGYHNGTATDNIVIGSARGNEYAGGLVGYLGPEGEIRSSFAAATVEGNAYVGPLVGYKHPAATVTNSASVTPAEMTDIATFLGAGLEICAVAPGEVNTDCQWNIEPGDYPFLSGKRLEQYNLTISSTQNGEVTSPGEGTFTHYEGSVVSLVAEAEEGYQFVNWTGAVGTVASVEDATTAITMNDDYSITANFESGTAIPLKNPSSFVQMTIGDVDSLDPAWGYDTASGEQVQYIYEPLLFYDGTNTDAFVPVLATEWNSSPDGMTIRFKIRDGVKFHNGDTLTPEDVEYSIERAMVQDRGGGPAWMLFQPLLGAWSSDEVTFADIDAAVQVDGDWVVFTLSDPAWALPFLQILCGPWASIVDKEWCIAKGEWDGTEETWEDYNNPDEADSYLYNHTNGTGPWKLEEWEPGVQIKLVRNDDYWREPAAFERVITQIVEEWTTRKLALLAGDADYVYVPRAYIGELEGIADLTVYQDLPELSIDAFFFNMDIASDSSYIGSGALDGSGIPTDFFTDLDVRKGFCYAFDWETYINDVLMGEAEQRGSPIVEGLPYYNPDASMYAYDPDKAEQHLKAAWGGELWEKGFKLTLLYNSGNLARETACEILAGNLLGINPLFEVSVQPMEWPTMVIKIFSTRDMPMFQIGWIVDYPDPDNFVTPFMHSTGTFAYWQAYSNPEVDALIEAGRYALDPATRKDIYYDIQELYYDDVPGIMLAQPMGRRYFSRYIHGFYFNPMISGQAGPLYYMSKSS